MEERYLVYKDFNTKDWCVYDNVTYRNVCHCDTEKEALEYIERCTNESNKNSI